MGPNIAVVNSLIHAVEDLEFDGSEIRGQIIDEEIVGWYVNRFEMLMADGVPAGIDLYLRKAQKDDMNDITRFEIMHQALSIQLRGQQYLQSLRLFVLHAISYCEQRVIINWRKVC